jgi:hypothetical protein
MKKFTVLKTTYNIDRVYEKEFDNIDETANYLLNQHFWHDLKEDWVSALYNVDNTYKTLQGLAVGETWKGRYYHEDMQTGELTSITIKRVA